MVQRRTSRTRSGVSLDLGRNSNLVSSWKTHLDVLWKLVDRMLQTHYDTMEMH